MKKYFLFFVVPMLMLGSCSIEKRQFTSGFTLIPHGKTTAVQTSTNSIPEIPSVNIGESAPDNEIRSAELTTSTTTVEEVAPVNYNTTSENSFVKDAAKPNEKKSNNRSSKNPGRLMKSINSVLAGAAPIATVSNTSPLSNGKSQLIALILCVFVGAIGIHRFYLGYTTIGIIQLLTGGGCGIWALIDLIRITTGDLKPKDGRYSETL